MTSWAVSSSDYGEYLLIDTSAGERMISLDPYERGGYLAPLDIVRGVELRDLVRVLRSERAADQMMVSRQSERWFDLDTADPAFTLRPGEPRRFELEFIFDEESGIADDDDQAESRRLGSLRLPSQKRSGHGWFRSSCTRTLMSRRGPTSSRCLCLWAVGPLRGPGGW